MKYAILGAAGAVGKELGKLLAAEKTNFRVVGRKKEELIKAFKACEPYVEYCVADLSKPEEAARALSQVETVFYTVGVPYPEFKLHPVLSGITVQAAAEAGVKHFVHLSTVYPYGAPQTKTVNEDHPREPTAFKGQMRKQQEDVVMAAHGKNGMQVTILCPPDFYGGDSDLSMVHDIFVGALAGRAANVIAPIDQPHEFIFVPDLARTLLELSKEEKAYGRRWNLGGAGIITVKDFADKIYAAEGRKTKLRPAGKLMIRLLGLFSPFMKELVEMHYLLVTPVLLDDSRLRQLLPKLRKTSYDDGIRITLGRMKQAR